LAETSSDFGRKNFCTVPVGEVGIGIGTGICGMAMIGAFGGPWPLPSCAIAAVVRIDVIANRVTLVNLILYSPRKAVRGPAM